MSFLKKLLGGEGKTDSGGAQAADPNRPQPLHISDADFESVINAGRPVLVDFWAEWCGPCHYIAPSVEQLAAEFDGQATIAKMDVDEHPDTPGRFGIMGIPTLIYFKDGQEADRVVGVTGYDELAAKLRKLL